MPEQSNPDTRVEVAVHRTVRVLGTGTPTREPSPALELTSVDGQVTVTLLPRNSSGKRQPVYLDDLERAVTALKG